MDELTSLRAISSMIMMPVNLLLRLVCSQVKTPPELNEHESLWPLTYIGGSEQNWKSAPMYCTVLYCI